MLEQEGLSAHDPDQLGGGLRSVDVAFLGHAREGQVLPHEERDMAANFYPRGVAPQVVEVAEGEGTKEVALALDPSAVDELLTRMGKLVNELERQPGETADEHERRVLQVILRENRR